MGLTTITDKFTRVSVSTSCDCDHEVWRPAEAKPPNMHAMSPMYLDGGYIAGVDDWTWRWLVGRCVGLPFRPVFAQQANEPLPLVIVRAASKVLHVPQQTLDAPLQVVCAGHSLCVGRPSPARPISSRARSVRNSGGNEIALRKSHQWSGGICARCPTEDLCEAKFLALTVATSLTLLPVALRKLDVLGVIWGSEMSEQPTRAQLPIPPGY